MIDLSRTTKQKDEIMAHTLPLELKDLETRTLWILSASHINTAEFEGDFGEFEKPIFQGRNEYAINLYVSPDLNHIQDGDYAPHIKAIMLEANRLGITELRFDRDGEVLECFKQFGDLE
jgi:hypothetical protein